MSRYIILQCFDFFRAKDLPCTLPKADVVLYPSASRYLVLGLIMKSTPRLAQLCDKMPRSGSTVHLADTGSCDLTLSLEALYEASVIAQGYSRLWGGFGLILAPKRDDLRRCIV